MIEICRFFNSLQLTVSQDLMLSETLVSQPKTAGMNIYSFIIPSFEVAIFVFPVVKVA